MCDNGSVCGLGGETDHSDARPCTLLLPRTLHENDGQLQGLEPSRMAEAVHGCNPVAAGEADAI